MPKFGYRVYGVAAMWLGVVGLASDKFAEVWQPVPESLPERAILAYIVGAIFVIAGASLFWRRTALYGAIALAGLFGLGAILLHIPLIVAHPLVLARWAGLAEQSACTLGGAMAIVQLADLSASQKLSLSRICWVGYGLCCLMFGAVHFQYEASTAALVPHYLPLGQDFWAYTTGGAHIAAGVAILLGVRAYLAAYLLTAMFLIFAVLVHAPAVFAAPTSHLYWTANAVNFTLVGSAWILADSLRGIPEKTIWPWRKNLTLVPG